ncbi:MULTISPECIES: NmrA family NAD(P)-binding protein [unclassified Crossiella]|uniref:NmrA family NAD(P)-binding protein n=1 Tax=unclassified Crossiella TaxID=2620835 RepID=UPI001FFE41A9|nr:MULTISPECIES: NmrA family NAD(P)-binding protein [unclassified Crossiella]MCK2239490.1 NAD(P)H-binding protein [Crossiella sp. S99.2]MCK2252185.1 NAD(P)H-binding protein [Crossiella sp. S99.1]
MIDDNGITVVAGATGNIGGRVLAELRRRGHRVRALTRSPERAAFPDGVEVAVGDLADPGSLRPALAGASAVFLLTYDAATGAPLRTGPELAKEIAAAGVRRVSTLWGGEPGPVEQAIAAAGLAQAVLRPVEFMSNTLSWVGSIRDEGVVREAFPELRSAMVHEDDIAEVAVRTLTEDGHAGRDYVLTGPEVLTFADRVRQLGAALGRDLRFVELTEEQAKERMRGWGYSAEAVEHVIGWYADPPREGYTVHPDVEQLLGRPARTFADWVAEHAGAFR